MSSNDPGNVLWSGQQHLTLGKPDLVTGRGPQNGRLVTIPLGGRDWGDEIVAIRP